MKISFRKCTSKTYFICEQRVERSLLKMLNNCDNYNYKPKYYFRRDHIFSVHYNKLRAHVHQCTMNFDQNRRCDRRSLFIRYAVSNYGS